MSKPFKYGLLIFSLSVFQHSSAQELLSSKVKTDTIVLSEPRSLLSFEPIINGNMTELRGKNIILPPIVFNSLFRFVTIEEVNTDGIRFKSCYLGSVGGIAIPNIIEKPNNKRLEFDSCHLQALDLTKQGNETAIFNCKIGALVVDSSTNYSLRVSKNSLETTIFISNSKKLKLAFQGIDANEENNADIRVFDSEIEKFEFMPHGRKGLNFLFVNDTINGFFSNNWNMDYSTNAWKEPNHTIRDTFLFDECFISADFRFYPSYNDAVFIFRNCNFGSKAKMIYLTAAEIQFQNCRFPSETIPFSTSEFFPTKVSFISTEIENLRMNFTSLMSVHIDTTYTRDMVENEFKTLFAKFKNEGKKESYKNLDLEYHKYSESKVWYFLDDFFWGHGYRKSSVFRLTGLLLLLFWWFNYKYWMQMQVAYPIVTRKDDSYYHRRWRKLKFLFLTALYTIYIFFSIRVSLDKLSFQKLRFTAAFLFQYLLGLISLFFILKYVIEI